MAKKKGRKSKKKTGTMMSMRSGFKKVTGTHKKKKRGAKEVSFVQVFGWCLVIALAFVVISKFSQ